MELKLPWKIYKQYCTHVLSHKISAIVKRHKCPRVVSLKMVNGNVGASCLEGTVETI